MGFLPKLAPQCIMPHLLPALSSPSAASRRIFLLALVILCSATELQGDTTGVLRSTRPAGCYCRCPVSAARSGCTKMCELPRYASRWWASSCARPHMRPPAENPGVSPRLPHPNRAEHAGMETPKAGAESANLLHAGLLFIAPRACRSLGSV